MLFCRCWEWVQVWHACLVLSCFSGMPRFASQPSAATAHQGDNQVMACEVNSDLVPFTRWEKDRQPLELSTRLVQLPGGALAISNASETDAGLYRCLVENVGSSKSSDEAQLQIVPGDWRRLNFVRLWVKYTSNLWTDYFNWRLTIFSINWCVVCCIRMTEKDEKYQTVFLKTEDDVLRCLVLSTTQRYSRQETR